MNPTQFGPKEDLSRYPRDLPGDLAKAASAGTDVAYCPDPGDVYPPGFQTYVQVREIEQGLDGGARPGHFVGVATVVCKLFNVVRPHVALFGEKDYQQLAVIRRMVADLEGSASRSSACPSCASATASRCRPAQRLPVARRAPARARAQPFSTPRRAAAAQKESTTRPLSSRAFGRRSRARSIASTTSSCATRTRSRP